MARSNLQNTRLSREMSQSQLATAAAINGRVLQTYEQGGRDLSGAKLATLLKSVWLSTANWRTSSQMGKPQNC